MRATLLSAGPSLRSTYDASKAGQIVIGVNTAAALYPVDYWSCCDQVRFEVIEPISLPALFTLKDQHHQMQARNGEKVKPYRIVYWEDVFRELNMPFEWLCFSAPSALILACSLGAKHIDCYGVDMAGTADVTGEEMKDQRQPTRWERETKLWADIVKQLNFLGVGVTRHGFQP